MRVERIGMATLYLANCREVLPELDSMDCLITDPPYGTGAFTDTLRAGKSSRWSLPTSEAAWDSKPFEWDKKAPEIVPELPAMFSQAIIWGGNYFPLPLSRGWLVWNKIIRNFSSSVCELAWTSLNCPIDCFDYSHGQLAAEGKFHPTQKPLPLMTWCVSKTKGSVLDPFMGSGTTGVACVGLQRPFVGMEVDPKFFDMACQRIENAQRQERMFA